MRQKPPPALWVTFVLLGIVSLIQFGIGLAGKPVILIAVALNLITLVGLYAGHRWAFVASIAFAALGAVVSLARNPATGIGVLIMNGIMIAPVILSKHYFWQTPAMPDPMRCPVCGYSLLGLTEPRCPEC